MFEIDAQRQFGTWLREVREQRGLRRPPVSMAMGYSNISHGCSMLAAWERGDSHPPDQFHPPLRAMLQISAETWEARLAVLEQQRRRAELFTAATSAAVTQLGEDLASHCDLLLAHRAQIAAAPHWRDITLPTLRFELLYVGSLSVVHLGDLLEGWASGALQMEDQKGQAVWLLSGAGSPLSGAYSAYGVDRHSRDCVRFRSNLKGSFTRAMVAFKDVAHGVEHGPSSWNLSQLLSHLGVPLAPSIISTQDGAVGQYDFATATLTWHDSQARFPQLLDGTADTPAATTPHAASTTSTAQPWRRAPGQLIDPQGHPRIYWSRALPEPVQDWLVHQLMSPSSTSPTQSLP